MKNMKKYINDKNIVIVAFILIFLFSNIIFPAGIAGGNYYEYSSGGFVQGSANEYQMVFGFNSVEPQSYYSGTMNWILRPLSKAFSAIDIRVLGTVYFLIVLCFFAFFIRQMEFSKKWHGILFEFLALFVFGDFSYLLHFNIMTTQGLLLCSLLVMTLILMIQYHIKAYMLLNVVYGFLCVFVGGLSEGWFILGILLSLLILPTFVVRSDKKYLITSGVVMVVSIGLITSLFSGGVSKQIKTDNLTNATFYGIYKDNKTTDLNNEKMPKEYLKAYSGKSNFEIEDKVKESKEFKKAVGQYSYSDILNFYLKNPSLFKDKLEITAGNAFEIRARYLANYPYGGLKNGFTLYSSLKRRFMQPSLWFVLVVSLVTAVFCGINIKKEKNKSVKCHYIYMIMMSFISLFAFVAPIIISGEALISENLFCYNILFDILFVNIVVGGFVIASARRDKLREQYGVNQ